MLFFSYFSCTISACPVVFFFPDLYACFPLSMLCNVTMSAISARLYAIDYEWLDAGNIGGLCAVAQVPLFHAGFCFGCLKPHILFWSSETTYWQGGLFLNACGSTVACKFGRHLCSDINYPNAVFDGVCLFFLSMSLNAWVQCYRSLHFQQDDVFFVLDDIVFSVFS